MRQLRDFAAGEFLGFLAAAFTALLSQVALISMGHLPNPPTWPFWVLYISATGAAFVFLSFAMLRHDLSLVWWGPDWETALEEVRSPLGNVPGRYVIRPPANWFDWQLIHVEQAMFSVRFRQYRQPLMLGLLAVVEIALWAIFLSAR